MTETLALVGRALADRYVVEREIGRGGMATVYLAQDRRHARQVAVKVLRSELSSSIGVERFRREIDISARLSHPNIVALYDSGEADGLLYYVMPYVEGLSLRDQLDRHGLLALKQALEIARDIAAGLAYAHEAGIVHRDINPRNILLSAGRALIADFGIARALQVAATGDLTVSGIAIGTPAYMSPEQAAGDSVIDARADVYAFGCVVYEMLAGEPPFRARTAQGLLTLHMARTAPSLTVARRDVPVAVADAVQRSLAKSPDERFSTALEFFTQLETGVEKSASGIAALVARMRRRIAHAPAVVRLLLAVAALVVPLALVVVVRAMRTPDAAWTDGRPASIVVLPFETAASTAEERTLAADMAAVITTELDAWETIRAVPQVSLAGPMFDLGLRGPTLSRIDDGARLTRELRVEAFLAVTLRVRADTVEVEATLFGAGGGRPARRPFRGRGTMQSLQALARPIASGVVGVDEALAAGEAPRHQSANPQALLDDFAGQRQLERWRLAEAERSFRRAIARDSAFAMAQHRLAETLYWQLAQDETLAPSLGPQIAGHSALALRHAQGLATRDSVHLRAFYAFQEGDYETARNLYSLLLQADSADVHAWLLLGSVESLDPWLAQDRTGAAAPRSDLNLAIRAFAESLRLQPTFELGYGHLFAIHRAVMTAVGGRGCPVFEMPTGDLIAPWDDRVPRQWSTFCPVMLDSIEWLPPSSFDATIDARAAAGADRLFDQSLRLLRRWAAYSSTEPKPLNELVTQILRQRSSLPLSPATRRDSLTREALSHASNALRLTRDTVPQDLIRLGNLYLAVDSLDRARALVEQGLALHDSLTDDPGRAGPSFGANVFLASGQVARALALLATTGLRRSVLDSTSGSLIPYGGAEPVVEQLRALGVTQTSGRVLRDHLRKLEQIWNPRSYTPGQRSLLRRSAALRIATTLVLEPDALMHWNEGLNLEEPLWQALVLSTTDASRAGAALAAAQSRPTPALGPASQTFLEGIVAARLGDHALAVRSFSRVDSVPFAVDVLDVNWGLRWTARLQRAASHEALGNRSLALADYDAFARAWASADSLGAPLLTIARTRAAALRDVR